MGEEQEFGEHEQPVEGAQEDDPQVHPEVVQSKEDGASEGQHHHPQELGQHDSDEHRGAHLFERTLDSLFHAALEPLEGEDHVRAKLYRESHTGDEVDNRDRVYLHHEGVVFEKEVADVDKPHQTEGRQEDHQRHPACRA